MTKPPASNAITLTQLRYFVHTAQLGSMSDAAAHLFVAQSAISAGISSLESALECRLFLRQRAKGVALTEQGRVFYNSSLEILADLDDAVAQLHPHALHGRLAAGCFRTLAPFWLPQIYEGLTRSYPKLVVTIQELTADEIEHQLMRRELEVALTYGFDYSPGIEFEPIAKAPVYAAVATDSPLAQRSSVTLQELANLPLILLDLGKSSNYFLSLFARAGVEPTIHQRFDSYDVVRAMVARGHGYSILNQAPAHDLAPDGSHIVRLPITGADPLLEIGVAHRSAEPLSRKGQAFIEHCRHTFNPDDSPIPQGISPEIQASPE